MIRPTRPLCAALCALLLAGCSAARKSALDPRYEVEVVTAEGLGPVVNGDAEGAKKTALAEALKSALGLVVGIYVSQEAMVSKAVLIDDTITSQTEGYVEKYEVLKEARDGDFIRVKVKAHVRREDLAAKLRALETEPQRLGNPVIGFDIKEIVDKAPRETNFAALELTGAFSAAGFLTGQKEKADIVITGTAEADKSEPVYGFASYRARLSVSAVKTGSGETFAAVQETAGGADPNEAAAPRTAIINAAKKSGEDLREKVLKALRERSMVRLSLSGVQGMNHVSDFLRSLRNIPAVRDCWLKSLSGGTAVVDVGLRGGTASDLSQLLMKNEKFPVKINRTSSYDLEAELQRPPAR